MKESQMNFILLLTKPGFVTSWHGDESFAGGHFFGQWFTKS